VGALSRAGRAAAGLAACGLGASCSALRGRKKAFHPVGCAFQACLEIDGDEPLGEGLLPTGSHPAVLRLSRGVGFPDPWPDILGLALRVDLGADRSFDLLFNSAGRGPAGKHLMLPARRFFERPYSTLLGYDNGADRVVVGLIPPAAPGDGPTLSELRKTWDLEYAVFEVVVAARGGDWRRAGRLVVGEACPEAAVLSFDPWNVPGPAKPGGFLNWLRTWAYPASQLVQKHDPAPGAGT